MSLRRLALPALALAVLGCQSSLPNESPPTTQVFAISFPSAADGTAALAPPFPDDLTLQAATCTPASAQLAGCTFPVTNPQLLALAPLAQLGGFPAAGIPGVAQPLALQIQLVEVNVSTNPTCVNGLPAPGTPATIPFPDLDVATVTTSTLALVRIDASPATQVPFAVVGYDRSTGKLTVVNAQGGTPGAPWATSPVLGGRYVVALRGGANGVKTKTGQAVSPQLATYLVSQDKDLTKAENQLVLTAACNPPPAVVDAVVAQLHELQGVFGTPQFWTNVTSPPFPAALGWTPVLPAQVQALLPADYPSAFAAVDKVFPHGEIASIQTFTIHP